MSFCFNGKREKSFFIFDSDFEKKGEGALATLNAIDAITQKRFIHRMLLFPEHRNGETDLLPLLLLLFLLSIPPPAIPHNPSCKKGGQVEGKKEIEKEREREISALPWLDG